MLAGLVVIALLFIVLLYCCHLMVVHHPIPERALVLVDDQAGVYFAPGCTPEPGSYRAVTMAEVHRLHYKPDPSCLAHDCFFQPGRCASAFVLECLGFLKPLPSRWNPDGSWNW